MFGETNSHVMFEEACGSRVMVAGGSAMGKKLKL